MATLRDIATEVGVSIRTVTRALSGTGYVRSDVRERILEIADRIGYRPDPVAQSLRLGRSRQIVVVSYSVDELHMAKIASLEQHVRPMGYSVSVMMARRDDLESDLLVPEIRSRKPLGVAVIGHLQIDLTPLAAALYAAGIPCVPVDAKSRLPAVLIDRPAGVAEAARHLIGAGRRRIVYAGPADSTSRIDGFVRAMHEHGSEPLLYAPGIDHSAEGSDGRHTRRTSRRRCGPGVFRRVGARAARRTPQPRYPGSRRRRGHRVRRPVGRLAQLATADYRRAAG